MIYAQDAALFMDTDLLPVLKGYKNIFKFELRNRNDLIIILIKGIHADAVIFSKGMI